MKIFLVTLALLIPAVSHAIEEPDYEVLRTVGEVEVRQYAPYVVAEVLVQGPAMEAGSKAFPILAGYIFGKNKGEKKFAMTAPVTQTAAPVRMAMTAPVTQTESAEGTVVQFVLPKGVTLASAPEPLDPRVVLREVPGYRVGAIRYSGFWSEANNQAQLAKLQAGLQAAELAWTGEPTYTRYNAPITPWFMRRNEIWLNLR
jgi:SOUL heme-binding protein